MIICAFPFSATFTKSGYTSMQLTTLHYFEGQMRTAVNHNKTYNMNLFSLIVTLTRKFNNSKHLRAYVGGYHSGMQEMLHLRRWVANMKYTDILALEATQVSTSLCFIIDSGITGPEWGRVSGHIQHR